MSTIKTSRPASPNTDNLSERRQIITPSIVGETYRLNFDESSDDTSDGSSSDSYSSENDSYSPESYSESLSDDEEFVAESSGEV